MKNKLFGTCLLLLTTTLTGCLMPTTSLDDYLTGCLAAEKGNLNTALDSLSQAIDKNPRLGLAYMARGEVYKVKGDYEKAAEDFTQVTKIEPYNFHAHYQLGLMLQYLKRFSQSIAAYQKAVEIRPFDPDANMNLALVYAQTGEPIRGLPYAQRAVDGAQESSITHANLGSMYAQLGQSDQAIEEFKKAIELNCRQPEVYINLSGEYIKKARFEQARNVLETARTIQPTPAVCERLGVCNFKLGYYNQATEAFQQSLQLDPKYHPAFNGLGVMHMTQSLKATPPDVGLARQALADWHQSLDIEPNQPVIKQLVDKYSGSMQP